MKRYKIHEYPCIGAYSISRCIYYKLRHLLTDTADEGGIIVFPEDIKEADTDFIAYRFIAANLFPFRYTGIAGAVFSGKSLCIDIGCDSGHLISLTMRYAKEYGRPVILKDFYSKKLYSIVYDAEDK